MPPKPFLWRKPTPAQIALIDRLVTQGGSLPYGRLSYVETVVLDELQKLGLVEVETGKRAILTESGYALKAEYYISDQVMVAVTRAQLDLLWLLHNAPHGLELGLPADLIPGRLVDVARRMTIRGWVERYQNKGGRWWARITESGLEVLHAVVEFDDAVRGAALAKASGKLH